MKSIILFLLVVFTSCNTYCQHYFSLSGCIEEALEKGYSMQNRQLDNSLNLLKINAGKSGYRPSVNAQVTYFNYPFDYPVYIFPPREGGIISDGISNGNYPVQLGAAHNYSAGLSVGQTLFDADFFLSERSKQTVLQTNELLMQRDEAETIYEVAKAYLGIIQSMDKGEMIDANIRRVGEAEKIMHIRVENEMAYSTELEEIQIVRKQLEAKRAILEAGVQKQKNYLKYLMGKTMDEELYIVQDSLSVFEIAHDTVYQSDLNTRLIDQQIVAEELQIKILQNKKLPELKAFVNVMAMSQGSTLSPFSNDQYWYNPSTLGLTLNVPIMDGALTNTQIEQHQVALKKSRVMKSQSDSYAQMKLSNAQSDLEVQGLLVEEKRLSLELMKKVHARKKDMFANELLGMTELLESNADLTTAENEFTDARLGYLMKQLELLKSTGMLKNLLDK